MSNWIRVSQTAYLQKLTKASKVQRFTKATLRWRGYVLERDGYKCVLCGSGEVLEAHHINRWIDAPLDRLKKANGVTLCRSCHQREHGPHGAQFKREIVEALVKRIRK